MHTGCDGKSSVTFIIEGTQQPKINQVHLIC